MQARMRVVAREVVPAPAFMRLWSAAASRGPVGLALAYARRPIWLAVKLPAAIAAVTHARKNGAV
jgi:hypothetical protein